jgi:hypothetical protein
VIVVFDL